MPPTLDKQLSLIIQSPWEKYRQRLKACRRDCNTETIHDLRTQSRQLLAILRIYRGLSPEVRLNEIRYIIKTLLDSFDDLRDIQVMLEETNKLLTTLPALRPFCIHLQQREQLLLKESQTFIHQFPAGKLKRKFKKILNRSKRCNTGNSVEHEILCLLAQIYASVLSRNQAVDSSNLATIHQLRLSLKKLRYILASSQQVLTDSPSQQLEQIKSFLTLLGDIQNSAVLFKHLNAFYVEGIPPDVLVYFQQQQQTLIAQFTSRQAEVLGFWQTSANAINR